MKNPKKPTRIQKKIIADSGLNWRNWLVAGDDNISLTIVNKESGRRRGVLK